MATTQQESPFEVVGEATYDAETDTLAGGWKALLIPVEGAVVEITLDGSLDQLQSAVGGFIEAVPLPSFVDPEGKATSYCNEEAKLIGLPFNGRATDLLVPGVGLMWGDHIAGPMLVCGFDPMTGEHAALPESVSRRVRLIEREAGA